MSYDRGMEGNMSDNGIFSSIKNEVTPFVGKWIQEERLSEVSSSHEFTCFLLWVDPRFYIKTQNYVCVYDMKIEAKLSTEQK